MSEVTSFFFYEISKPLHLNEISFYGHRINLDE